MSASNSNPSRISRRSLLASMGAGGVLSSIGPRGFGAGLSVNYFSRSGDQADEWTNLQYGTWGHDDAGLPCFDADLQRHPAPFASFCHLMSTGTLGALADQGGNIKLISTENGPVCITPASGRTRSGCYAVIEIEGQLFSLIYSELTSRERIRYGTGYIEYTGILNAGHARLDVRQEVYAPPNKGRSICAEFSVRNRGDRSVEGTLRICSDVFIRPGPSYAEWVRALNPECGSGFARFSQADEVLGDVFLISDQRCTGSNRLHALELSLGIHLEPGQSLRIPAVVGYGGSEDVEHGRQWIGQSSPELSRQLWSKRIPNIQISVADPWIGDECRWSVGQLFAFENYDRILDQHYLHLGGYSFFPDPDNPRPKLAFTVREAAQNALVVSRCEPAIARSTLKWLAKMQLKSGDIPKNYNFTRERVDISRYEKDSDTEIWFLLALCEYIEASSDMALLDERLQWFPEGEASMWDHAKRAFDWITKDIAVGQHGLIRILDGDWNDYLSTVGSGGKGESVMNSGMAARAFDSLIVIARKRGDSAFASEAEIWRDKLRLAVGDAFNVAWFTGCYNDAGNAIAHYGDRLYLNAQSWAALGKCGTREQRIRALNSAVKECESRIGLLLMSKAYSSPPPSEISWCPIPRGEGENGGVWPQASFWAVWAMAEEGMLDLAMTEWKEATLRNHARRFPEVRTESTMHPIAGRRVSPARSKAGLNTISLIVQTRVR